MTQRARPQTVTVEIDADLPPEAVTALQNARWQQRHGGRARLTTVVPAYDASTVVAALEDLLGVRADWGARRHRTARRAGIGRRRH